MIGQLNERKPQETNIIDRNMNRKMYYLVLIAFMSIFSVTTFAQKCARCNGHRVINSSVSTAGYGLSPKIGDCTICGHAIFKNESHHHQTCPSCGGSGRRSTAGYSSSNSRSNSSSYTEPSLEAWLLARIIRYGPKLLDNEYNILYNFMNSGTADAKKFKQWYDILICALCMNNENVALGRYRGATSQTVAFEQQQRERTVNQLNSMVNTFSIPDNISGIQGKLCKSLDDSYNSWIGLLSTWASLNDAQRRLEDELLFRYSIGY